jgi:hypothetical protein
VLAELRLDVDPQVHVVAAELARVAVSLDNYRVPALFEVEDPKLATSSRHNRSAIRTGEQKEQDARVATERVNA